MTKHCPSLITQKRGPSDFINALGADDPRGFCYQGIARKTLHYCLSSACIRHYFPRRGRQTETAQTRVTGISPLRGSLRAASIKMAGQEYHYHPDEVIAKQFVRCFMVGWVPLAAFIGRLLCGKPHRRVLAHPPKSLCAGWRFVRERISVAGYDRVGPVFFKVLERSFALSLSIGNFFEFCTKIFILF